MKLPATTRIALAIALFCFGVAAHGADDILIADFEGDGYGPWEVTGEAFGSGPAHGTLPRQMKVSGYRGKGLVNSYYGGDGTAGTLTSPPFEIERRYLNFLIGGGMHPGETCMNLVVDGAVVCTATGPNDRPGGSEWLHWETWDVSAWLGKTAHIEIVDAHTGGWGHINVDHIHQSDLSAKRPDLERNMKIDKRYLNIPVQNGVDPRRLKLVVDDEVVRDFDIGLASGPPDFWAFLDMEPFMGKTGTLTVTQPPDSDPKILDAVTLDDAIKGAESLYREKLRPQFHFSSRRGWNNDPNGLVYSAGEYHLFYQHNPYGTGWGNMHWGHAVSADLVHWRELPIALYPREHGDWCFSGSAVVDAENTAGFKTGSEDVLVAAYTSTGRGEAIAYSNDRGRTWTDYEGNPVVEHQGRDPKLLWHEASGQWVMAVYHEVDDKKTIAFHTSPNLKDWTYQSLIDGFYECPDLFELPVDGDPANTKWVLLAADGHYMIGAFDGHAFVKESGKHRGNYGNCFYASQTWSDAPEEDGRRIQIAWARVDVPEMPFNQMMTFPCELTLRTTAEGVRLFAEPVGEIESLYRERHAWEDLALADGDVVPLLDGELLDIQAEFEVGDAKTCGLRIRGVEIAYDTQEGVLRCGECSAPMTPMDGKIRLRVLVDRPLVEVFGNDGLVSMAVRAVPEDDNRFVEAFSGGGTATVKTLAIHELASAWPAPGAE